MLKTPLQITGTRKLTPEEVFEIFYGKGTSKLTRHFNFEASAGIHDLNFARTTHKYPWRISLMYLNGVKL